MAGPALVRLPSPAAASEIEPEKVASLMALTVRLVGPETAALPSTRLPAPDRPLTAGVALVKPAEPASPKVSGPLPSAESVAATSKPALTIVPPLYAFGPESVTVPLPLLTTPPLPPMAWGTARAASPRLKTSVALFVTRPAAAPSVPVAPPARPGTCRR